MHKNVLLLNMQNLLCLPAEGGDPTAQSRQCRPQPGLLSEPAYSYGGEVDQACSNA